MAVSMFTMSRRAISPRSTGPRSKYPPASCVTRVGAPSSVRWKRKNSASAPAIIAYPSSCAFAMTRFSAFRGSPGNGSSSGVYTSQISRPTRFSASPHG